MDTEKTAEIADPNFGKREPIREVDALFDQKVFGHATEWRLWGSREMPFRKGFHDYGMPFSVPYYHEKIQDAWLLVDELVKRGIQIPIQARCSREAAIQICDAVAEVLKFAE